MRTLWLLAPSEAGTVAQALGNSRERVPHGERTVSRIVSPSARQFCTPHRAWE